MTRVAIDLFGVTVKTLYDGSETVVPEFVDGAIAGIKSLISQFGASNCFIISLIAKQYEDECRQALHRLVFYNLTGFLESNVHFVHSNSMFRRNKPKTVAALGITDYIDDQPKILRRIPSEVNLYWFRLQDEPTIAGLRVKFECMDRGRYPHFDGWELMVDKIIAGRAI